MGGSGMAKVSILSFNREMQTLLASFNIWGKLNRHGLSARLSCRHVRMYTVA